MEAGPITKAMNTASTMGRVRRNAFSINFIGCVVLWGAGGQKAGAEKKPM
jgi:hypothetical protein